ncbi:MAG TPA: YdcF family protein [Chitinophagaceae bacterium]|nr:YdcF family protein [Chitinophagaceae bacterium]
MKITDAHLEHARTLWEYHHMFHTVEKSDCILVLGSHDLRVAERGADLYLEGQAPLLVFSGGLGNFTKNMWSESEAELFARIAISRGVPPQVILKEDRSTNTGENILFTRSLLEQQNLFPESFIVVQKPYMERRSYATFRKLWPDKKVLITSPQLSFDEYPTPDIPLEMIIHIMVGDLQRIKIYPGRGFQVHQDIPEAAWNAYLQLVHAGFTGHMISEM